MTPYFKHQHDPEVLLFPTVAANAISLLEVGRIQCLVVPGWIPVESLDSERPVGHSCQPDGSGMLGLNISHCQKDSYPTLSEGYFVTALKKKLIIVEHHPIYVEYRKKT